MSRVQEALNYFNSESFHGLFAGFRKKYESLGRMSGSVPVSQMNEMERHSVAGFMGITVEELAARGKISMKAFERQLEFTRFEGIDLKELLEAYFNEEFVTKKERLIQKQDEMKNLFSAMKSQYPTLQFWIEEVERKTPSTYIFYSWIEEDEAAFHAMIEKLAKAFELLPHTFERLPMFSQRVTQNPHAFDVNSRLGKLLIHLLSIHSQRETVPSTSEEITDILYQYAILRDDLMNFTTCVNVLAETEAGLHPLWQQAAALNLVRNIPLRELLTIRKAYLAKGVHLFVVENSGVCSTLMDLVPQAPIMVTHGQVKLSSWMLLDMLVEEGTIIHYAGDFDPEGLRMAELMYKRYPDHVRLWRMTLNDYIESEPDVRLQKERLRKLDALSHPTLKEVAFTMKHLGKAGYQESLVEEMVQDIEGFM